MDAGLLLAWLGAGDVLSNGVRVVAGVGSGGLVLGAAFKLGTSLVGFFTARTDERRALTTGLFGRVTDLEERLDEQAETIGGLTDEVSRWKAAAEACKESYDELLRKYTELLEDYRKFKQSVIAAAARAKRRQGTSDKEVAA